MAERSDGCSGETLLASCTRKKRLQRKMTKDYYWIGAPENIGMFSKSRSDCKGGFPVMAEITCILAANIPRQFFFVITTTASTRCLVENFELICYSQRVNATSEYNNTDSSRCSKWSKDRIVAVVKHCWLLVQGKIER